MNSELKRAKDALRGAVKLRGAKAPELDPVTRSLLVAFSAIKAAERLLASEESVRIRCVSVSGTGNLRVTP